MTIALASFGDDIYGLLLAFLRVCAALMLLPGFGETWVPPRIRLGVALALSGLLWTAGYAAVEPPAGLAAVLVHIASETVAGLIFGACARLFLAAPAIAGQIVGQSSALTNIFSSPGLSQETSSVVGVWLMVGAIAMIFATNLHLAAISALAATYDIMPAGEMPHTGDAARGFIGVVSLVFLIGVKMAAPFLLLGFVFNLGVGLVNRMMTQLPMFFVAMPISIVGALLILSLMAGAVLVAYSSAYGDWLLAPFGR